MNRHEDQEIFFAYSENQLSNQDWNDEEQINHDEKQQLFSEMEENPIFQEQINLENQVEYSQIEFHQPLEENAMYSRFKKCMKERRENAGYEGNIKRQEQIYSKQVDNNDQYSLNLEDEQLNQVTTNSIGISKSKIHQGQKEFANHTKNAKSQHQNNAMSLKFGFEDSQQRLTEEQQLQKMCSLIAKKQLKLIQEKISRYQRIRQLFFVKYPSFRSNQRSNDNQPSCKTKQVKSRKNGFLSRYSFVNQIERVSNPIQPIHKRMKMTEKLLKILAKKFETYHAVESGSYDPGYKISITSIGSQLKVGRSSIYRLYNEWLQDPGFSKKISKKTRKNSLIDSDHSSDKGFDNNHQLFKTQNTQNGTNSNGISIKNALTRQVEKALIKNDVLKPKIEDNENPTLKNLVYGESNSEKTKNTRLAYCDFFRKIQKGFNAYFVDECPKQTLFENSQFRGQSCDFSLLGILSMSGLASWKIVKCNGSKYSSLDDVITLYNGAKKEEELKLNNNVNKNYLILDFSIAKKEENQNTIKQLTGAKLLFLPPQSQLLNPLEYWFRQVCLFLKKSKAATLMDLNAILLQFSGTDFTKYIREMNKNIEKGIKRQDFL